MSERIRRFLLLTGAAGVFTVLATFAADAAPCANILDEVCSSIAFFAYAQADEDDGEDDEDDDGDDEFGDVDLDDEERGFEYHEDEGSLLVDQENCEPGKYWMMDFEDGVMLPCR